MPTSVQPHKDRSAAVKQAILTAAHELFTQGGFESTGVRDIATRANVNPAIVIRHFGSKENLFLLAVDSVKMMRELVEGPADGIGERVVRKILRGRRGGLQMFGNVVRASGRDDIRRQFQETMSEVVASDLAARFPGPDSELRAHLFVAQLFGLMSALSVYDDEFLLEADIDKIAARYGDSLQHMLADGASEG